MGTSLPPTGYHSSQALERTVEAEAKAKNQALPAAHEPSSNPTAPAPWLRDSKHSPSLGLSLQV